MTKLDSNYRSLCPLSTALDLIGDKWSLLIVRDMCLAKSKYGDFQSSPEGIPSNILAQRLRQLEDSGIIEKVPYQQKPLRYEYLLTAKGADLLPVLQHLVVWAHKYVPDSLSPPAALMDASPEGLLKPKA
jgi:DNA-binding HxlR family transcriptional regulator